MRLIFSPAPSYSPLSLLILPASGSPAGDLTCAQHEALSYMSPITALTPCFSFPPAWDARLPCPISSKQVTESLVGSSRHEINCHPEADDECIHVHKMTDISTCPIPGNDGEGDRSSTCLALRSTVVRWLTPDANACECTKWTTEFAKKAQRWGSYSCPSYLCACLLAGVSVSMSRALAGALYQVGGRKNACRIQMAHGV